MIRFSIISLLFSLIIGLASCDKCENLDCENGSCTEGVCICDIGFVGQDCATRKSPKSVIIDKIVISKMQSVVNQQWDSEEDGTAPDVFLFITKGVSPNYWYISSEVYQNATTDRFEFTSKMPLRVDDVDDVLYISLGDQDELTSGGGFDFQQIYWFTHKLYWSETDYPDVITYQVNNNVGKLEIYVRYLF